MKNKSVIVLGLVGCLLTGCGSEATKQDEISVEDTLVESESVVASEDITLVNEDVIENIDYTEISNFSLGFGKDMPYYSYTTTKDITLNEETQRVMTVDATVDTNTGVSLVESMFVLEDGNSESKLYTDAAESKLYSYMPDEDCWYIFDSSVTDIRDSYSINLDGIMSNSWVLQDEGESLLTYTCSDSPFSLSYLSQGSVNMFSDIVYEGTLVVNKKDFNLIEHSFTVSGNELDVDGNILHSKTVDYKLSANEVGDEQSLSIPKEVVDNAVDFVESIDN